MAQDRNVRHLGVGAADTAGQAGELRKLTHTLLLCASQGLPAIEFLTRVMSDILDFIDGDAVELWIRESSRVSRWEMTRHPRRLYRLRDPPLESLSRARELHATLFTGYRRAMAAIVGADAVDAYVEEAACDGRRSLVLGSLSIGADLVGLMILKSRQRGFFDPGCERLYRDMAQTVAFVIAFQLIRFAQRECVKELSCLYHIGRTASECQAPLQETLRRIVAFLPPAWQYPEISRARVTLDEAVYESGAAGEPRDLLKADIVASGRLRGAVEVEYLQDRPVLDEGPFLREERRLLDLVAEEIALIVEQKKAEEERLHLEEQIRRADRLATLGQLAAGVAHELNEPLSAILGFTQLAKKVPGLPRQAAEDLERIQAASLYAREVVRKLMLFARRTPPSTRQVNVNQIVEECMSLLDSRGTRARVETARRLATELPTIAADPSQITQLVINLLVNALQAMPQGGKVTVETAVRGDRIAIGVADTGIGMEADIMSKIFDPFFTTKDIGEGTGLGLAVVHGIVMAHGGTIAVQSKPGQGSYFEVLLPIVGADPHAS